MSASRIMLRTAVAALTTTVALAAGASSASAGVLVASAPDCDDQALSKTFLPWLDIADYTALSGGDFETGAAGWSLTTAPPSPTATSPGASAAPTTPSRWRSRPARSATSPTICVGLNHPTVRFFAKRQSGGWLSLSTLRVDVLFETASGTIASLPIGVVGRRRRLAGHEPDARRRQPASAPARREDAGRVPLHRPGRRLVSRRRLGRPLRAQVAPDPGGRRRAGATPARSSLPRATRALALLLLLHDVGDELEDLVDARRLRLTVREGLAPVGDVRLLGHDVEERARHLDAHAGVLADALRHEAAPRSWTRYICTSPRPRSSTAKTSFSGASAGTSSMNRLMAISMSVFASSVFSGLAAEGTAQA